MIRIVPDDEERRRLRLVFDLVARRYDEVRPNYPEALIDDLVIISGIPEGSSILEVGPGTGQATMPLAERGYAITGVELGPHLAAIARERTARFANVRIETRDFEEWDEAAGFDLVLAATSWHWIDPTIRYKRAARLLVPGGTLAVIETHHVVPAGGDPFFAEIQDVYEAIGEDPTPPPDPDEIEGIGGEIAASGRFVDVRSRRYLHERPYTAEGYIAVLETYSGHRAMQPWQRERLYAAIRERLASRPGGSVRKHYLFELHVARRRTDA
jgi:SAM-dependent methyltransferase